MREGLAICRFPRRKAWSSKNRLFGTVIWSWFRNHLERFRARLVDWYVLIVNSSERIPTTFLMNGIWSQAQGQVWLQVRQSAQSTSSCLRECDWYQSNAAEMNADGVLRVVSVWDVHILFPAHSSWWCLKGFPMSHNEAGWACLAMFGQSPENSQMDSLKLEDFRSPVS